MIDHIRRITRAFVKGREKKAFDRGYEFAMRSLNACLISERHAHANYLEVMADGTMDKSATALAFDRGVREAVARWRTTSIGKKRNAPPTQG